MSSDIYHFTATIPKEFLNTKGVQALIRRLQEWGVLKQTSEGDVSFRVTRIDTDKYYEIDLPNAVPGIFSYNKNWKANKRLTALINTGKIELDYSITWNSGFGSTKDTGD